MNKLILLDGGPASGKNTLGSLIVNKLSETEDKAVLLDLDTYVEEFNPKWMWKDIQQKEKDLLNARINFKEAINKHLQNGFTVVAIGDRFMTKTDLGSYKSSLKEQYRVYLYHLSVPFELRQKRLHERGPHSLIDLEQDQKDRDAIKVWTGYVYKNISTPETDALNLITLIQNNKGGV